MIRFHKVSKQTYIQSIKDLYSWDPDLKEQAELYKGIRLPERGTKNSAGYDFFLPLSITLKPGEAMVVPTGIKCEMNSVNYLAMHIRSSVGIKHGIILSNGTGIIDSDFYENSENEGHIMLPIRNLSDRTFRAEVGDRIAQGIISTYLITIDDAAQGIRTGGIGSTN